MSHTALIWAHFLGEERNMLNAVSTALSTSGLTFTAANDTTGTGLPATSSSSVYVTLSSAYGETAGVSAGTVTNATAGQGVKVAISGTVPYSAVAVNIYVVVSGTTYKTTTPLLSSNVAGLGYASITGTYPSTDGSYNSNAAGSNSATGYDGFISTLAQSGGYQKQFNGSVSAQNEAGGFLQDAFLSLIHISEPTD